MLFGDNNMGGVHKITRLLSYNSIPSTMSHPKGKAGEVEEFEHTPLLFLNIDRDAGKGRKLAMMKEMNSYDEAQVNFWFKYKIE